MVNWSVEICSGLFIAGKLLQWDILVGHVEVSGNLQVNVTQF